MASSETHPSTPSSVSPSKPQKKNHHHHNPQSKNGVNKEIHDLQTQLQQSQAIFRSSRKRIENLTKMAVRIHRGLIRQMEVQHGTYPTRIPSVQSCSSEKQQPASGSVSSLKFSQMLYSQLPVRMKAKDAVSDFPALSLWQNPEYLKKALSSINLTVAQTPTGLADAPGLRNTAFLQPHVTSMNAENFLNHLKSPNEIRQTTSLDDHVLYMQSQNNNYPREFPSLTNDAPHSIPWADEALNAEGPAAVNLWLGDCRTTSRLHNDNYENLYIQVSGSKELYLIPPGDAYALDERFLKPLSYGSDMSLHDSFAEALQSLQDGDGATFAMPSVVSSTQDQQSSTTSTSCGTNNGLKPTSASKSDLPDGLDHESNSSTSSETKFSPKDKVSAQTLGDISAVPNILFPTVDPSNPSTFNDIYSNYAFVYRVVLNPGDMLYIPALWYHQVRVLDGAPNVSLNYWYDPPATNGQWMRWDYVRYCSAVLRGYHDPHYFDEKEEKQEIQAMLKMENQQQMQMMQQQQKQRQYQERLQLHQQMEKKKKLEK